MPVMLFVFAWIRFLPLALLALLGVGWGFMMVTNNAQAVVQSLVPDQLRGRVMGVYTLVFFGSMPIGALLAGSVAGKIGEPLTVMSGAALLMFMAIAAWIYLPDIRKQA